MDLEQFRRKSDNILNGSSTPTPAQVDKHLNGDEFTRGSELDKKNGRLPIDEEQLENEIRQLMEDYPNNQFSFYEVRSVVKPKDFRSNGTLINGTVAKRILRNREG